LPFSASHSSAACDQVVSGNEREQGQSRWKEFKRESSPGEAQIQTVSLCSPLVCWNASPRQQPAKWVRSIRVNRAGCGHLLLSHSFENFPSGAQTLHPTHHQPLKYPSIARQCFLMTVHVARPYDYYSLQGFADGEAAGSPGVRTECVPSAIASDSSFKRRIFS